ncbi:hypothetical protein KZ813_16875 [Sphingomonas sp. RHCKR7]|nr:hypothetical protein [Sphingomonas folli]
MNRRVRLLEGVRSDETEAGDTLEGSERTVLLGSPGMGKSTLLRQCAARTGGTFLTARELATRTRPVAEPVYIDALDEYRASGSGRDKIHAIAQAMERLGVERWRLSCREEDWRAADAKVLDANVVATLLALGDVEAARILEAHGVDDPAAFIHRAKSLGGEPFLGNPLLLLLLHSTVAGSGDWREGTWPSSRFELYTRATLLMAAEYNDERLAARPDRPGPSAIIDASGRTFALTIMSDVDGLPHRGLSRADAVGVDELLAAGIDTAALDAALDSGLWQRTGDGWVPTHRTIAEFLGGKALADAVNGAGRVALPLNRIVALINGDSDHPPTPLRGLHAWLVTHLSNSRRSVTEATRLVRSHPENVLFYGDAAALSPWDRQHVLDQVGRRDRWFMRLDHSASTLAGLVSPDLEDGLANLLVDASETVHRRTLVAEALRVAPLAPLLPLLAKITLDPREQKPLRRRAAEAFMSGHPDGIAAATLLLGGLARHHDETSFAISMSAGAKLVPDGMSISALRDLLRSIPAADGTMLGYTQPLRNALRRWPTPRLFDAGKLFTTTQVASSDRLAEARAVRDVALEAAILSARTLSAERLVRWIENAHSADEHVLARTIVEAVRAWLNAEPRRSAELLDVLAEWEPRTVVERHRRLTGDAPGLAATRHLVSRVCRTAPPDHELVCLAVELTTTIRDPRAYWRLYRHVDRHRPARPLDQLTRSPWSSLRRDVAMRRAEDSSKMKETLASNAVFVDRVLTSGTPAELTQTLDWAARRYLERGGGWNKLEALVGTAQAHGIERCWDNLLRRPPLDLHALTLLDPRDIADGTSAYMAALARALETGTDIHIDEPSAILALNYAHMTTERYAAERITALAVAALNTARGRRMLGGLWYTELVEGRGLLLASHTRGPAWIEVAAPVAAALLDAWPKIDGVALEQLLAILVGHHDESLILRIAERALATPEQKPASREAWAHVAFSLSPADHAGVFLTDLVGAAGAGRFVDDLGAFREIGSLDPMRAVKRDELFVAGVGCTCPPPSPAAMTPGSPGELVADAIARLRSSPTQAASDAFGRLIANSALKEWHDLLAHHGRVQAGLLRDINFKAPSPMALARALNAGQPANAADLLAVIVNEIDRIAAELRGGDLASPRQFWNSPGHPNCSPRTENDCRDHIAQRLRDRLERYGLPVTRLTTESRHVADRRADLRVEGDAGSIVPIEVKRHWNRELWSAIDGQLEDYAAHPEASGAGLYLVLWFGRAAGRNLPTGGPKELHIEDAAGLEAALRSTLSPEQAVRLEVRVLDVQLRPPRSASKRVSSSASS